jgi:uncharacterized protein YndB with AHSA1/START domain
VSADRIVVRRARETTAPQDVVFALLSDSSTYPNWSDIGGYEMERPGFSEPHGVGEIRVFFSYGIFKVREEILELTPNRHMAYSLLSGLPMRNYRGETTLEPLPNGGTRITWQSSFEGVAGTGWFMRWFMAWVLKTLTDSLATGAEASAARPKAAAPVAEGVRP